MRIAIALAGLIVFAATAASAQQSRLVGKWDVFDDGCRSGYLEYDANGEFAQVYRRDETTWIADPLWGDGSWRLDGDILYTNEAKRDGSIRVETKERLSFSGPNAMEVEFLKLVWVDNATGEVKAVEGFEESWTRCPPGAAERAVPITVAGLVDADLVVGRWGWSLDCGDGYIEYTHDGRIWMVETNEDGEETMDPDFQYGLYEVKGATLLEVYAYRSGTWTSETNFAFDDSGRLFFSDGMKTSWTEADGGTSDDDPFFEVLFRCAAASGEMAETDELAEGAREAQRSEAFEAFLFDSDVAMVSAAIAESKSRCGGAYEAGEPGEAEADIVADCIDYFWGFLDVSGDGLLSLSEIARGIRLFGKWSAAMQAESQNQPLNTESKLGLHIIGVLLSPFGARPVLDSYDYDDDGLLSRAELFNDTDLVGAVELSRRPMGDLIDIEDILAKLQMLMRMTME